jgi:hypothetical protein
VLPLVATRPIPSIETTSAAVVIHESVVDCSAAIVAGDAANIRVGRGNNLGTVVSPARGDTIAIFRLEQAPPKSTSITVSSKVARFIVGPSATGMSKP